MTDPVFNEMNRTMGRIEAKVERNYGFTKSVASDLKALADESRETREKLAKYENRGLGILSGLTVAAGAIGASASHFISWFKGG